MIVRDATNNASGLPELPDAFYVDEDAKMADAEFVVKKYLQGDLSFEPGTKFNYSNADFLVLGEVIQAVTGKSFEVNLQDKILKPLGMTQTGLLKNETVLPGLASGYDFKNAQYVNEGFVQIENFGAAGAMYSTAEDMLRWDKALLGHELLSKALTDEMFRADPKLGYAALGSWRYPLKIDNAARAIVERQGHINGFSAVNLLVPEDGLALVFLGNVNTQALFSIYSGKGLSADILKLLYAP